MKQAMRFGLLLLLATTAFAQIRGMHGGGFRGGFSGGGFRGGFAGGRGGFVSGGGFHRGFVSGPRGGFVGGFRGGFVGGFHRGFVRPGFSGHRFFGSRGFIGHRSFLGGPYFGLGYGYSYPSVFGGYGYGYSEPIYAPYAPYAPPVVQYVEPYGPPAPIVVNEEYRVIRPEVPREYDHPLIYLIAFKDGTIRAAVAYWTSGRTLHFVTREDNEEHTAPLENVDRDLSRQLNRERRVPFWLPASRE